MIFPAPDWDISLFQLINGTWRTDFLDFAMPIVSSKYMVLAFIVPIVCIALFAPAKRRKFLVALLLIGVTVGATEPLVNVIKETVGRPRPHQVEAGAFYYAKKAGEWKQNPVEMVAPDTTGKSFISAHAANSMVIAVLLALLWPKLIAVTWTFPLLVGYSRIYLAKHYPVDVLGGWLFGFILAVLLWSVLLRRFVPDDTDDSVIRIDRVYS